MTATARSQGAARLLAGLLPPWWPHRVELLAAAAKLDAEHPADASDLLLDAWRMFATTGDLPASAGLRELVAALVELLGGVGAELRHRPRPHALAHPSVSANASHPAETPRDRVRLGEEAHPNTTTTTTP